MMNNDYEVLLKERDIKPTAIRILIIKEMMSFNRAFNLSDLERALDTVDKSTISRTINLFHKQQLIHSFDDGSGSIKYSLCKRNCHCSLEESHAHFYCNYCKQAFCLQNIHIPKFELSPGMQIESVNLVIKGYCGKCRKFAT